LCQAQSRIGDFVLRSEDFTSQLTTHIGLLKGIPNALYRVWESEEGGKIGHKILSWVETKCGENGIFFRLFC